MKPIRTVNTDDILRKPKGMSEEECSDLPITRIHFGDGSQGVESCWQLSEWEIQEIVKTGRVYVTVIGTTHAPLLPSAFSCVVPEEDEGMH